MGEVGQRRKENKERSVSARSRHGLPFSPLVITMDYDRLTTMSTDRLKLRCRMPWFWEFQLVITFVRLSMFYVLCTGTRQRGRKRRTALRNSKGSEVVEAIRG